MKEEIKPLSIYTTNEVKKLLSIGDFSIWKLAKEGKINFKRIGKRYVFLGKDLLKFLEAK